MKCAVRFEVSTVVDEENVANKLSIDMVS
jgi:hypothetical protein